MYSLSAFYIIGRDFYSANSTAIKIVIFITHCYIWHIDDCVGVTCTGHGTCVDGVNSHATVMPDSLETCKQVCVFIPLFSILTS